LRDIFDVTSLNLTEITGNEFPDRYICLTDIVKKKERRKFSKKTWGERKRFLISCDHLFLSTAFSWDLERKRLRRPGERFFSRQR
jgi:hypothetical protein